MEKINFENCYVAIVIYNQCCADSMTCKKISKLDLQYGLKVFIADNSTDKSKKEDNQKFCQKRNWCYIDMKGNKGLSKAYNGVISQLNRYSNQDIIVWFDDDTDVTELYFSMLFEYVAKEKEGEIFVPIIRGNDGIIYSPNERGFLKNHLILNKGGNINPNLFNAINSCMAVKTCFYKNYLYDETLFMDMVDQKFCVDATRKKTNFVTMNVEIVQNFFQRSSGLTAKKAWERYKIRIRDFMNYANTDVFHRWLGLVKVFIWGIDLAIRCKSFCIFLKCVIQGFECAWKLSIGKSYKD